MISTTKKRLNRHNLIGLDPLKYNEGQVIHFKDQKNPLNSINTGAESPFKVYNNDVQKCTTKNVINVDWFEATILLENPLINKSECIDFQLNESVVLLNTFKTTNNYNSRWRIIYLGEEIGTILTNPKSIKKMKIDQAQIKIENRLLYTCDWLDTYKEILNCCNWNHKNITRLDIAIDGLGATKGKELASKFDSKGNTGVIGRKGKALFRTSKDQNNQIKKFFIGSASSDKIGTIYPKSQELEHSGKDYIRKSWDINRLDYKAIGGADKVDRFELRLSSKKLEDYDWAKLDRSEYIASIARTECRNWFEFYSNSKDSNKYRKYKNNKTMEWIDWDSISGELLPKHKAIVKTGIHRAKRIIKDLTFMEKVENMNVDQEIIHELINEYSLHKWYNDKIDHWESEFRRERNYRNINSN